MNIVEPIMTSSIVPFNYEIASSSSKEVKLKDVDNEKPFANDISEVINIQKELKTNKIKKSPVQKRRK